MSYNAPSISDVTADSGDIELRSGTFRIKIHADTPSGFENDYSLDVESIGGYEMDFDASSPNEVTDFLINITTFEFTVRNSIVGSSTQKTIIEWVDGITYNDIIVCELVFDGNSEYYYTTKEHVTYNKEARNCNIKAFHPLKYNTLVLSKTYSSSLFSAVEVDLDDASKGIPVYNFIEIYMGLFGGSLDIDIDSSLYEDVFLASNGSPYLFLKWADIDTFDKATEKIKNLAFCDGAIIGSVMGHGFYANRAVKNNSVSLSASDFISLDVNTNTRNARNFDLTCTLTFGSTEYTVGASLVFNALGANDINVSYAVNDLYLATYDNPNLEYDINTTDIDEFLNDTTGLGTNPSRGSYVVSSYRKALRAEDNMLISGTLRGVSLLPSNTISVSSGVDDLIDGKEYAFSYLKYDLMSHTTEFEAYQI
tara:strand:+ start:934 stop:2202 length:1269 start_codon:yes stop_codon:yes gene_type:complete